MTRSVIALTLVLILSGCLVGQRSTAPDADKDLLPDELEVGGWNITITKTLRPCFSGEPVEPVIETRFVQSDKALTDTDLDDVSDFDERFFNGDPNRTDTDGDGLLDGDEWELRSDDSFFAPTRLALNKVDSDEDCLSDAAEIGGFDIPGLGHRTSDPTASDGDADGFTDAWEFQKSHSEPLNPDTDGDGSSDGLDLDPLHDVWMRVKFTTITVKDFPANPGRIGLYWSLPAKVADEAFGYSGPIEVTEGQPKTLDEAHFPGDVDVDDQRGGSVLIFEFYARVLNDQEQPVQILDINPHNPGAAVQVRYDVATDKWEFRTSSGYTPAGTSTSLETSQARITFTFEDFSPEPSQ